MRASTDNIAIVFGILSCRSSAAAISQFAAAVAPHKVLVHHDFFQTPDFHIDKENVVVMPSAEMTSWGSWSLVRATTRLIEAALASGHFDYFQLVSETCLPSRPIAEYEEYLRHTEPDAMIDMQPVRLGTQIASMNYAWRYLPRTRWLARIARVSGQWWLGRRYTWGVAYGGNMKIPAAFSEGWLDNIRRYVGMTVLRIFALPIFGAFPLGKYSDCWVGGQWFGISRLAAERILGQLKASPALEAHYKQCHIPDESYIHTIIANCAFSNLRPGNHVTFWDGAKSGPDQLVLSDLERIKLSGKFFARKFTLEPTCPVRQGMLSVLYRGRGQADLIDTNPGARSFGQAQSPYSTQNRS